jgi:tRNA pseudouridine38-40 synthase
VLQEVLFQITGERTLVFGSGRTDSGVHAKGQVAHFTTSKLIDSERWRLALNMRLPRTIRVLKSDLVPDSFHAQKSAVSKIYEYRVLNRLTSSALDRQVYFYPRQNVDWKKMRECLPYFVGEHDFKSFQGAKANVKTTVRTIFRFELDVEDPERKLYRFTIEGSGFLKQMVRNVMGTVLKVGEGKLLPADIPAIINSRDRRQAGRTVPACGLCLVSVKYL